MHHYYIAFFVNNDSEMLFDITELAQDADEAVASVEHKFSPRPIYFWKVIETKETERVGEINVTLRDKIGVES